MLSPGKKEQRMGNQSSLLLFQLWNPGKVASSSWASVFFSVKWDNSPCAAGLVSLEGHNVGKHASNCEVRISRMKILTSGARSQGSQNLIIQVCCVPGSRWAMKVPCCPGEPTEGHHEDLTASASQKRSSKVEDRLKSTTIGCNQELVLGPLAPNKSHPSRGGNVCLSTILRPPCQCPDCPLGGLSGVAGCA